MIYSAPYMAKMLKALGEVHTPGLERLNDFLLPGSLPHGFIFDTIITLYLSPHDCNRSILGFEA
ncbi:hypothetical protein [Lacticaseibacillus saniviri]|uniref:hypothetical protein n=1 Tax=Lacticaseibacillus saniviri TaxID=931533 RepID=UPI0006D0E6DD|nr:hypothetical protein [Lacticaseibacillus saniviri]